MGVNDYVDAGEKIDIPILRIDPAIETRQATRTCERRASRDAAAVTRTLQAVTETCRTGGNVVPPILDAVRAYATLGEIVEAMREVFGSYREPAIF